MNIELHPRPARLQVRPGRVTFAGEVSIACPAPDYAPLHVGLTQLKAALNRIAGCKPQVVSSKSAAQGLVITLASSASSIPSDGYRLGITSKGIQLEASTTAGIYYGIQTLCQILDQTDKRGATASLSIQDAPSFSARGMMLDISRCKVPKLDTLKQLITQFSRLKINQLQLYTEHTYAFADHRTVWKNASPLTSEDILELDRHCRQHFIELVPNFNSFGHWERWLRHAEYKSYANRPEGFTNLWGTRYPHGSLLKPNAATLQLLDRLYEEFLANFSSAQFNVGCDETFELGTGWSEAMCKRRGTEQVYLDFLKKINALTQNHQRKMMFWGDIIIKQPDLIPALPKSAIALEWGYEANHPFKQDCQAFAASGIPFYVCPGTSSWNSLTGRSENALGNLSSAAREGAKQGATGYLVTDWGDNGHHQYLPISYVPFAAGACLAWNAKQAPNAEAAASRFFFEDDRAATLFAKLGHTHDGFTTPFANSSAFHHLLFHGREPHEKLLNLRTSELRAADKKLQGLREQRSAIKDTLTRREFVNAIDLARYGVHRGLRLKQVTTRNNSLKRIRATHRELWLARNRRGGLPESLSRLPK